MKNRPLLCLALGLIIFLLGQAGLRRAGPSGTAPPGRLVGNVAAAAAVTVTGRIYKQETKSEKQILYLKDNRVQTPKQNISEERIIIYLQQATAAGIGQQVSVSGKLYFFERERNPGNFNTRFYYEKQRIAASVQAERVTAVSGDVQPLADGLSRFRVRWQQALTEALGPAAAGTLNAIMLGDKAGLDDEVKEIYQQSGIGHIFAISGLHISIIGLLFYQGLRRLCGSYLVGGLAGIAFLLLYILMIGFSVSVQRALIMYLFRVGAGIFGRKYDAPTALFTAAAVSLSLQPLYGYDAGFYLSYLAVAALIFLVPLLGGGRLQFLLAGLAINVTLFGVICYTYYEVPLYGIFLNLLIIPLMTILLLTGLLGSLLLLFAADLGQLLLQLCRHILRLYRFLSEASLGLPGARIITGQPPLWLIICYYLLLAVLVILLVRRQAPAKLLFVALYYALSIVIFTRDFSGTKLAVTVLDVGQGDGIYLQLPNGRRAMIDGGSTNVDQVGRYRLEPFLKSRGTAKIDYWFVTHGDADHLSGLQEMLERGSRSLAVGTLVLPSQRYWNEELDKLVQTARQSGVRVTTLQPGQRLSFGKATLSCLAPDDELDRENSNAASLVLGLRYGDFGMLFTGDAEGAGEEALTAVLQQQTAAYPVLKVAHHGSKNSTGSEFLAAAKPALAVISAGEHNPYGHPHPDTLERLTAVGAKTYATPAGGAVQIRTDGRKMTVKMYLPTEE